MNEQIEKLAKQVFDSGLSTDPILYYEVEQFANLIIKECSNIIQNQPRLYSGYSVYDGGYSDGMTKSIELIKEHFGVEE